jgi:DNA repair protein RadD
MIELRDYQHEAVQAVYGHLRTRDDNPCVVLPTAAGKTPVMAQICKDAATLWDGRVLVLAHVKELLEQTARTLSEMAPELDIGVHSAGLGSRDTEHAVIVAGIQSVYRRAPELGRFDLIMVDEAHLLPPDGEGMYRSFLVDAAVINPHIRLVGLTATPYRMKTGTICEPDHLLNHVCYEIGVKELIVAGYLCPLKTKATRHKVDTDGLHVRAGEFIPSETQDLMDTDELVRAACEEIIEYTRGRRSCLIFASGVEHGRHVARVLREEHGVAVGEVYGHTPPAERDELIARFRGSTDGLFSEPLHYLVNVNVLTTGFDAPNIDCIAMLRPTMSPGLYYQQVGRGFRIHESKQDCLVLDFGGNVLRHGPVDQVRISERFQSDGEAPAKECPECHSLVAAGYRVCPECGYEFPPPERSRHDPKATTAGILSGEATTTEHAIQEVFYSVHQKRDAPDDHPKTMRVEYRVGWQQWQSEFICFEHTGWARVKGESWWRERSDWPVPDTVEEAVEIAGKGGLCETLSITVRSVEGEKYDRIVGYKLGPKPTAYCDREGYVLSDKEIPF